MRQREIEDRRPFWLRLALEGPAQSEAGPDTAEALGDFWTDDEEGDEPEAPGAPERATRTRAELAWRRLATALDARRHARALRDRSDE